MALGQFGSLTYGTNNKTYNFSISGDAGLNFLLTKAGKVSFTNPIISSNQPQANALENIADEGHVEVLS